MLLELPTIRPQPPADLVEALLAEQQSLTAVERFARLHESGDAGGSQHAPLYRDLIPLSAPQPGEQYAFTVDLDACSGCKACVTACHSLNGLDDGETFRDVGAVAGRDVDGLHVLQHVTTACHHCLEPACLAGCPTLAYDKDPVTGIVRHLDDQCIGCQYCTLMCPYDVPKYNSAKGIVRKCDMCRQRLTDGEAPACVAACPNQAIRIDIVRCETVTAKAATGEFLAASPDPRITLPATRFVSRRELRDVEPAESQPDRPAHAHLPLVFMLVLTQMSVGMFVAAQLLVVAGLPIRHIVLAAAVVGVVGLSLAVLHLGRPQIAWRAWLGWRTSWMSREIIVFGLFGGLGAMHAAAVWFPDVPLSKSAAPCLGLATCVAGLASVICSAMIYVATRREFWTFGRTVPKFAVTAALLGLAGAAVILALTDPGSLAGTKPGPGDPGSMVIVAGLLIAFTVLRFAADRAAIHSPESLRSDSIARSADLLVGPLRHWYFAQAAAAAFGGVILPLFVLAGPQFGNALLIPAAILLVVAELIQRGLFFAAVVAPRMPGVSHE